MRKGRKSAAQTKAPLKDRIKGSKVNKTGSASSRESASAIILSDEIIGSLKEKVKEFNEKNKNNKVSLNDLKAVFRRGAGAFSTSHRPNMTRNGWAYARVNKFLDKKSGKKVKESYVQDDDLMEQGGKLGENIQCINCGWEWNTADSEEFDKYVCHKCGFDNSLFYSTDFVAEGGLKIEDNGLMNSIYPELKQIFANNGLILNKDYSFTDGSNKSFLPFIGMYKTDGKVNKVGITYYENGFEALGEVEVEINDDGKIEIEVEFPNWNINEETEIFEKGGKMKNIIEQIGELVAPFQRELADQRIARLIKEGERVSKWEQEIIYLSLVYDLYNAIGNYLSNSDKLVGSISFYEGSDGSIEISANIERDGKEHKFRTEVIIAGGYNIQRRHYRYIVHTDLKYHQDNPEAEAVQKEIRELKEKVKSEKKIEEYKNDIEFYKNAIENYKKEIEINKNFSDKEIWDLLKEQGDWRTNSYDLTWEEMVSRKAPVVEMTKDKEGYEAYKYENYYLDGIKYWKATNIDNLDRKIKSFTSEIKKIEKKLQKAEGLEKGGELDDLHEKIKEDLLSKAFKSHKDINQIANEKGVDLDYAQEQLIKGMKVESEHSNDPMVQEIIALQHLDEMIDYYDKLEYVEGQKMEKGGQIDPDNKKTKDMITHKSGNAGGLLVGNRHSEGGIKAINKSTNTPLEMEGGEVVITRNAVSDDQKREFEGEMLTNREILSKINEGGGGVSFEEGGAVDYDCECDDKMANGGKLDSHSELKGFFQEQNTPVVVEESVIEVLEEVSVVPEEIMLFKEDLTTEEDAPMIYVGSSIYANNPNGTDEWVVKSFTEDGINLTHNPLSPLSHRHDDRHLSFNDVKMLFASKSISIKFVLNERELNLILMILKDKLNNKTSFKDGGIVFADKNASKDEEIMESQFGNKKF